MKAIVTGGAGFIGSNFLQMACRTYPEDSWICLDALTYAGTTASLASLANCRNFRFVKGDITDRAFVHELFASEAPDVVIHFAAETHVDRSLIDPFVFERTNVGGTITLLEEARIAGVQRFHQISTDEVYGDLPLERPDLFFTESSPLRPSSPYSASKASADLFVHAYGRSHGLPVTISRCSNNFGPWSFPEKLIPLTAIRALSNKSIPIYGTGLNTRDWLFVSDHCRAIDCIVRHGTPGEIYNVCSGRDRSNLEVVGEILDLLHKPRSLITLVADRPGHDKRYAMSAEKLSKTLGWEPQVPFEEGLRATLRWYVQNRAWWEPLLKGEFREYFASHYSDSEGFDL